MYRRGLMHAGATGLCCGHFGRPMRPAQHHRYDCLCTVTAIFWQSIVPIRQTRAVDHVQNQFILDTSVLLLYNSIRTYPRVDGGDVADEADIHFLPNI